MLSTTRKIKLTEIAAEEVLLAGVSQVCDDHLSAHPQHFQLLRQLFRRRPLQWLRDSLDSELWNDRSEPHQQAWQCASPMRKLVCATPFLRQVLC